MSKSNFSESPINIYRKIAKNYDSSTNLLYLMGFRFKKYRMDAVKALNLSKGDKVVELGCGTGLNFSLLQNIIGSQGKIIGVDITDKMLSQAKKRIKEKGWNNVELVQSDVADYKLPKDVDGIITTFALIFSPSYDQIIKDGYNALKPEKQFVILDMKMSSGCLKFLAPLLILLTKSFGVDKKLMVRHPWESIKRCFEKNHFKEYYGGFVYLSVGKK